MLEGTLKGTPSLSYSIILNYFIKVLFGDFYWSLRQALAASLQEALPPLLFALPGETERKAKIKIITVKVNKLVNHHR